jgi:hypothetical protein
MKKEIKVEMKKPQATATKNNVDIISLEILSQTKEDQRSRYAGTPASLVLQ